MIFPGCLNVFMSIIFFFFCVVGVPPCFNLGLGRLFFSNVLEIIFRQVYCPLRLLTDL